MGRFSARDDLLHDISGAGPHARESLLWTAPIPSERLLVFLYMWRGADDRWGRFVFVGGEDMFAPEYVSFDEDARLEGTDLDDCTVGGLALRQPEPLRVAEVAYADADMQVELELRFEGIHDPFSWHENEGGCPDWVAMDRFEQSCLTSGRLRLRDRELTFAGAGHRDHSWGSRDWNMLQHWKWMNATAGDSTSLHVMIMDVKGERILQGYLNRDGEVSPVVAAEASADLDARMIHRAVSGRFTDAAGRSMALECEYAAGWQMPIQHLLLNEIGMQGTIDGEDATVHVELGWPAAYVAALVD
jgi:hypothetical protein